MKSRLLALICSSVRKCVENGLIPPVDTSRIEVEVPANPDHGDYATNAAMALAREAKQNPRKIAEALQRHFHDPEGLVASISIAGPGFMNFVISNRFWLQILQDILNAGADFGRLSVGRGKKVQVEFVSANPTGPLHIGHARGAVVGDALSNLLQTAGFAVSKEYYINDAGNQMNNLGRSVLCRYRELLGETIAFPENGYRGDYIRDIAAEIVKKDGKRYLTANEDETIQAFNALAGGIILEEIKQDLKDFGVVFDEYFSEKTLYENNGVLSLLDQLRKQGFIYSDGETLWFKTTDFGDEKDRVVIRKNGDPTYFAADIAYHQNKFSRGFDLLVDIWGADHHGYMARLWAAVQALGHNKDDLRIVLVQLVNLLRAGEPVAMSTRSGEFVTLREVLDEVGKDAARYNFLMRRSDSHLDFDLEVAKKQSNENPVYYVQYAHARICSIMRMAAERGVQLPDPRQTDTSLLSEPEERTLIKMMARYPEMLEGAVLSLEVHRLTFYLNELAGLLHGYYNKYKVITDDAGLTAARLVLMQAVRVVLANALCILGVDAPEKM
ncbi:MAG TPA: arginine--tRNA ligase [Smithellaceae bacterium]|nr:arginine--tRNA ligase [Smithellaceae bacterium]